MDGERIAEASAYPWAPDEKQISFQETRKRKGSGVAVLHQTLNDSTTNKRVQEILKNLLGDEEVVVEDTINESARLATTSLTKPLSSQPALETIDPNVPIDDEQILRLTQEGRLSLLGSIVRVVGESVATPVFTSKVLSSCILAVRPGDVPGHLDAKDMVLAALLFLSSTHKSEHWTLPLIRPTQENVELERRSYELVQSPTESQLQWLETAFLSSTDKFLPRDKYCPRLADDEEGPLLRKGVIPPSAIPKTPAAKRKATLAAKAKAASPTPPAITS